MSVKSVQRMCGLTVDIARQMERPDTLRRVIVEASELGYDTVFLYAEGALEYKSHPKLTSPVHLTQDEYRQLQALANSRGVDLPVVIPAFGHTRYITEAYPDLSELSNGELGYMRGVETQICISNLRALEVIRDICTEWAAISTSPYLHVGCDESWHVGVCSQCRSRASQKGLGGLVAEHINRLGEIVRGVGKRCVIWADMPFYYNEGVLDAISRDIVMMAWHYTIIRPYPRLAMYNHRSVPTLQVLADKGFEVIACPNACPDYLTSSANIQSLDGYARKHSVKGMVVTTWELRHLTWDLLSPAIAYGAAVGQGHAPHRLTYLRSWAATHFQGDPEPVMEVVEQVGKNCAIGRVANVMDLLEYGPDPRIENRAARVARALALTRRIKPLDPTGTRYLEDAQLLLDRAHRRLRLRQAVNELATALIAQKATMASGALAELDALTAEAPALLERERSVWTRNRYAQDPNPAATNLSHEVQQVAQLVRQGREVMAGQRRIDAFLPEALELHIINDEPAFQCLAIEVAQEQGAWKLIYDRPQCQFMNRHDRLYVPLPTRQIRFIRLRLRGLGQLGLVYLQLWHPAGRRVPEAILGATEGVDNPECLLVDDYRMTRLGRSETSRFFQQGVEQPEASLTVRLQEDPHWR